MLGGEPAQERGDVVAQVRVESGGGLVQQQHFGTPGERAGQREPSLLPARQGTGAVMGERGRQMALGHDPFDGLGRAVGGQFGDQTAGRHPRVEGGTRVLAHVGDVPAAQGAQRSGCERQHVLPQHLDAAGGDACAPREFADQGTQQGRLAGAGRPGEGGDPAAAQAESGAAQEHGPGGEADFEAGDGDGDGRRGIGHGGVLGNGRASADGRGAEPVSQLRTGARASPSYRWEGPPRCVAETPT